MKYLKVKPNRLGVPKHQQGVTLIVTMIFIVLLTFLGVHTIQDTALEEKMAANLYHSNIVFQAAEDALRDGEDELTGSATIPDFNNTGGYYEDDYDLDSSSGVCREFVELFGVGAVPNLKWS